MCCSRLDLAQTSIIHHKLPSNTPIDPLPLGLLIAAWALLMLLILALNLPVMYIFYATDQLQSSRAKYIFTMLLSGVLVCHVTLVTSVVDPFFHREHVKGKEP